MGSACRFDASRRGGKTRGGTYGVVPIVAGRVGEVAIPWRIFSRVSRGWGRADIGCRRLHAAIERAVERTLGGIREALGRHIASPTRGASRRALPRGGDESAFEIRSARNHAGASEKNRGIVQFIRSTTSVPTCSPLRGARGPARTPRCHARVVPPSADSPRACRAMGPGASPTPARRMRLLSRHPRRGAREALRARHRPADFERAHVDRAVPAVLTDVAASWPCASKWTLAWFAETHGDVRVAADDGTKEKMKCTLREFVENGRRRQATTSRSRILSRTCARGTSWTTSLHLSVTSRRTAAGTSATASSF